MDINFWGVRGSLPSPVTQQQIQTKIFAALQRVTPGDLKNKDTIVKFIDSLPAWIKGTVGGNTPCVELVTEDKKTFVFDAGTGIRMMGKFGNQPESLHYNLFFSHFHWDHIQGFPFFEAIYNPKARFDVYSPFKDMELYLAQQMKEPFYPVSYESVSKNMNFHVIEPEAEFTLDGVKINSMKMSHPGTSYSYSVVENGKKFVYATDVELSAKKFSCVEECKSFFENADVMVMDAQYTAEESLSKENWGHSAFCYAVDFAVAWNIKKLYLFHHEPAYDDRKLSVILDSARLYAGYISKKPVEIFLACEGETIKI